MQRLKNIASFLKRVFYFFPLQLLLVHFKKTQSILIFWVLLFAVVTSNAGIKYGFPYLFLDAEYLGDVTFWSFLILGFSLGGFIMAFHISSYIRNAFRFPFLATLSYPFLKYCINNSTVPFIFIVVYIFNIWSFQQTNEFTTSLDTFIDVAGLLLGVFLFIIGSVLYFRATNKDIFRMFNVKINDHDDTVQAQSKQSYKSEKVYLKQNLTWKKLGQRSTNRDWHVETYLTSAFRIKIARGFEHYEKEMIKAVFKQNHNSAALFDLLALITLLILGSFRETSLLQIPAAASVLLLMTILLMISSAMHTWLRGWTNFVLLALFILLNSIFQIESLNFKNKAYGLDYSTKVPYNNEALALYDKDTARLRSDVNNTLNILKNWKIKNTSENAEISEHQRPKLVIINCSGGGSRSSMWVVAAMQYADSICKGELMKHTVLFTGSSGGIVGAAYLREMYLRKQTQKLNDFYNKRYAFNMGKDILNPIILTIATNDMFLRLQKHKVGDYTYVKDRGYTLERGLQINSEGFLSKKLMDYEYPEKNASIPMLITSPTILNDGRRLLISSQPISYLTNRSVTQRIENEFLTEAIEFRRLFKNQNADNIEFTSALRLSATFPYISPVASLPSEPSMDLIDAGMRDNYGLVSSVQFLYTFRQWIAENTSGVVIVQLRDRDKEVDVDLNDENTVAATFASPVGSFYSNLFHMQDYNNDFLIRSCNSWFGGQIDIVNLELHNLITDRISLSWHLTTKEKLKIMNSLKSKNNEFAFKQLKYLIR